MSIGICFDDGYSDDFIAMEESSNYYKLRDVIRETISENKKMAKEIVREADAMLPDKRIESIEYRGHAIGLYQANINLLQNIIKFGLGNVNGLIEETDDEI